ncbi:MAG: PrsW family glutamic-type intramembrane protease [Arachnia sp.]
MADQVLQGARPRTAADRAWWQKLTWLVVLIAGVGFYLLVLRTLVATENINFFPSLILLGSITVPATVLVFAWDTGRQPAVSARIVAVTAVCGGIIGTLAAGTLEYDALKRLGTLPMLAVGVIEELAKMVVPAILLLVVRRPKPGAGLIVGVASGMGFATLETMGYGFTALLQAKSLAAVDETLLLRALLAPAGHVAWTGMTVAALWQIPIAHRKGRAVAVAVGALVLAVVLHTLWDGSNNLIVHIAVVVLSLAILLVLIHRSHRIPRVDASDMGTSIH